MNFFKRLSVIFLVILVLLTAGCAANKAVDNSSKTTTTPTPTVKPTVEALPTVVTPTPAMTIDVNTFPLKNCRQAMFVIVSDETDFRGTMYVYEKDSNNKWNRLWVYPCVVGQSGVSANRHEGDMTTPEGIFGFLYEFGSAENPGTKMEYKQTHQGDYWSSLNTQSEYNTWVVYNGNDPDKRFGGHDRYEDLYEEPLYKYAAALDFNTRNKVLGKGSGIFLHIAPSLDSGTAGCVALEENNLLNVLKWMDPQKNPKICIGTNAYLKSLK